MLINEVMLDGNYTRLALLVAAPFLFCVSIVSLIFFCIFCVASYANCVMQFFSVQIVSNITMCIGPVAQYHENSKYYSAVAPPANKEIDHRLPHVTIEMPVYKESLTETMYAFPYPFCTLAL